MINGCDWHRNLKISSSLESISFEIAILLSLHQLVIQPTADLMFDLVAAFTMN